MGETLSPSPNGARTFDKDEKPGWPTLDIPTTFPRTLEFLEGDWNHRIIESTPWAALAWLQEPLIADLMSRVRSPQAIGHTVRDSLWSSMRICVSSLQIAVFFQTFRINSSGHSGSFRFWTGRANVSDNRTLDAPSLRSSIVNVGPGPHV